MTCPQIVDSGAYVLGALPPSQRSAFETHMAQCEECRHEVNELAVLPGLLGRIDVSAFDEQDDFRINAIDPSADVSDRADSMGTIADDGESASSGSGSGERSAAEGPRSGRTGAVGSRPPNRGRAGAASRPSTAVPGPHRPDAESIIPGVITKINRRRRRRRLSAVIGALAVACLALFAGFALPHQNSGPTPPVAAPSTAQQLDWHQMQPMTDSAMTAKVALTSTNAGTTVAVKCRYPSASDDPEYGHEPHMFALFVYPKRGGQPQQIGTWTAAPGAQVTVPAVTAWSIADVSEVELRSADGTPLLKYDVT